MIDVARGKAVLLNALERAARGGYLRRPDGQFLDHDNSSAEEIAEQIGLITDEANIRRIQSEHTGADFVAPAAKIGQVMLAKMSDCFDALRRRLGIKDDLDQPEKGVVLDDEDGAGGSSHGHDLGVMLPLPLGED